LSLLHELVQTYRPSNVPEVIAAKTSEFWGQTKRLPHETIDQFFNRFHDLLDDLQEAEEPIFVKTKRQLAFEVPAGFRRSNSHQQLFGTLAHTTIQDLDIPDPTSDDIDQSTSAPEDAVSTFNTSNTNLPSSTIDAPIVRAIDKASSSLPSKISMSEDYIRACIGFRRVDILKQHFSDLYQTTVTLDSTPPDAVLDSGNFATMRKKARNTVPVPRSSYFGETIHIDIVFGPDIAVGNVHYGLLFTDRFSRMTYLYPLQNLTSDIPKQLQAFFAHIGRLPTRLISDFDLKLIGGKAREYLNNLLIHINPAPAHHQDKNGLAEHHWQTMVSMARNWLASAELPLSFWYYTVRCAAEVCNYLPYKLEDGSFTTPFELAHN
jgi:hypothetical protein